MISTRFMALGSDGNDITYEADIFKLDKPNGTTVDMLFLRCFMVTIFAFT